MTINYYEYIHSDIWYQRSEAAKDRAGRRCQVCNTPEDQIILETHHRTYERLGYERNEDLIVLCSNCHETFESSKAKREFIPRGHKKNRLVFVPPTVPKKLKD